MALLTVVSDAVAVSLPGAGEGDKSNFYAITNTDSAETVAVMKFAEADQQAGITAVALELLCISMAAGATKEFYVPAGYHILLATTDAGNVIVEYPDPSRLA